MKNKFLTGALVAGTMAIGALGQVDPAEALTFNGTSAIVGTGDVGQSFTVNLDENYINSQLSTAVSSTAKFTLNSFTSTTTSAQAVFEIVATNTSSLVSRLSVLGFDVNPNVASASVTGVFNTTGSGQAANLGPLEVCFKDGGGTNNCSGGGSGGISQGTSGTLFATLNFNTITQLQQFTLDNFGVRYQSISGSTLGDSGTGRPNPIPTPALLPGAIGMGIAAFRKKKREQDQGLEAATQEA